MAGLKLGEADGTVAAWPCDKLNQLAIQGVGEWMATVAESLALAEQYYQTDQHAAAEQICRQIVEADPQHADALYLLGILACQAGRYAEATAHLQAAVGIR